jgi:hypothetical protein
LIEPLDDAKFTSWDTAATLYTTINAGSIQLTQARNTGQSLTVGAPPGAPITASLGLTASQGETRVESFNATSQVDNLTVSVLDGHMRIRRQGGVGIDLTGNTIVKVDITAPPSWAAYMPLFSISSSYQDKNGKWVSPQSLKWKENVAYLAKAMDIMAKMTLTYTVRHIVSGDETVEEKDDTVREITVVNPPVTFRLVPKTQVSPPIYAIWANRDVGAPPVYISRPTLPRAAPFCFESYDAAQGFLAYIKNGNPNHPQILGNAVLGFGDLSASGFTPLKPADVEGLNVAAGCP